MCNLVYTVQSRHVFVVRVYERYVIFGQRFIYRIRMYLCRKFALLDKHDIHAQTSVNKTPLPQTYAEYMCACTYVVISRQRLHTLGKSRGLREIIIKTPSSIRKLSKYYYILLLRFSDVNRENGNIVRRTTS